MSKEFKVGDKVYFPYYGTGVFELQANGFDEDLGKYPLAIGGKTFTVHGKNFDHDALQGIFRADENNHLMLERLYGVEFEKPPVKPTRRMATLTIPHYNS